MYVPEQLREKAKLYEDRASVYGENYKKFGGNFKSLLGSIISGAHFDEHDINRLAVFMHILNKLSRYAATFHSGGHDDSLDDIAVYAMMLKELDHESR